MTSKTIVNGLLAVMGAGALLTLSTTKLYADPVNPEDEVAVLKDRITALEKEIVSLKAEVKELKASKPSMGFKFDSDFPNLELRELPSELKGSMEHFKFEKIDDKSVKITVGSGKDAKTYTLPQDQAKFEEDMQGRAKVFLKSKDFDQRFKQFHQRMKDFDLDKSLKRLQELQLQKTETIKA